MSTSVRQAKSSTSLPGIRPNGHGAIAPMQRTAITARSKPSVPPANKDGASVAVSMKPVWKGCVPISPPQPTKKPYVNVRFRWNRSLQKPKTGMVCGAFACEGCGASTVRHSCEQQGKISNGCSKNKAGDDGRITFTTSMKYEERFVRYLSRGNC
jgi:hypothetical protein